MGRGGAVDVDIPLPVRVKGGEVDRFVAGLAKAADRPATDAPRSSPRHRAQT